MKLNKILIIAIVFPMVFGFLSIGGTADAQDLSIWSGEWFRVNVIHKGYQSVDSAVIVDRTREFLYFQLNLADTLFTVDVYSFDENLDNGGSWVGPDTFVINILGGTDLDFLCWIMVGDLQVDPNDVAVFTARLKGKEDRQIEGTLKKATFRSLGGCAWNKNGMTWAAGESLKGIRVPESKVPEEILDLVQQ